MRILVVCGAGASSTFVAQRLQRAAVSAGLDLQAAAVPHAALAARIGEAELVLIGPHLTQVADSIREDAARHGVSVIVLPEDIFTDRDGRRTLDLITNATASLPGPTA
jgi:cellobiose PTS system EIIB component